MVAMLAAEGVVVVKDMEREQSESDVMDGEVGGIAGCSTGGRESVLETEFVKRLFMGRRDHRATRVLTIEKG